MIIRWTIVLALLYHSFAYATPNVRPHYWARFHDTISGILPQTTTSAPPNSTPVVPISTTVSQEPSPIATRQSTQVLAETHNAKPTHSTQRHTTTGTHHSSTHRRPPTVTRLPLPGQTVSPGDVNPIPGSDASPHSSKKGPNVAQIFFEVLGAVAGALVLLALLRCLYVYKRTPANRCPPTPEVGEVDRTLALLRNPPRLDEPPPPPPYQHAPEYDTLMGARSPEPRPPDQPPVGAEEI